MINSILTFVIGVGVGAVTSIFIVKKHYEEVSKQEIESVKEVYAKKKEMDEASKLDEDLKAVNEVIKKNDYATESEERVEKTAVTDNTGEDTDTDEDEDEDENENIYIIPGHEFGATDNITITLWYWTDGTVTNDNKKIIGNVEDCIGDDFMAHFGDDENDPDAVYVRNDVQKIDYEILKEYRGFSDYLEEQDE